MIQDPKSRSEAGKPQEPEAERDFGDSAGYGGGGSALDYREVGDVDPEHARKRNPLDDVMRTPPSSPGAGDKGGR